MAHINFSAPVIRLGTASSAKDMGAGGSRGSIAEPMGARRGLGADTGMDRHRPQRDGVALVPPTREEVMRTIFIGKIPESLTEEDLENILRAAGSLRRWTRAYDADSTACTFGFAEYEDAESLETATEVLQDIEVPAKRPEPSQGQNGSRTDVEKVKLLVQVDDASRRYAEEWREKRGDDESAVQFRIDSAKELLASVLADIYNPSFSIMEVDRDAIMHDSDNKADPITGEIITIPLTGEDELSDIPPEMRETVAAEIASFRDRSNRRDLERLRREEELEAAEKRANRSNQVSTAALSGPAGSTNGIPLGPRGAPSGPKGFSSGHNGVSFVNGTSLPTYITQEEEGSDASDEELERRRQQKKVDEQDKLYLDYERRWLNRERSRASALDREKARDEDESGHVNKDKETAAKRLKEFNDDAEQSRRAEEYYRDRNQWLRNRAIFRAREKEMDDRDRAMEEREKARELEKREHARGLADSFLERQAEELGALQVREPQRFKISLGAAAQRAQAAAPRRTIAEVEGLLEDEEEVVTTAKRTLVPIKFDSAAEAAGLTDEERHQAVRQLAADIPTDKEGLWAWDIQWDFVDDSVLTDQIRPFVEKKMVEYLGVQEEMLVDVVEEHIKKRGSPEELVKELEGVSFSKSSTVYIYANRNTASGRRRRSTCEEALAHDYFLLRIGETRPLWVKDNSSFAQKFLNCDNTSCQVSNVLMADMQASSDGWLHLYYVLILKSSFSTLLKSIDLIMNVYHWVLLRGVNK
jgi:RNA recognition motif-containing protein